MERSGLGEHRPGKQIIVFSAPSIRGIMVAPGRRGENRSSRTVRWALVSSTPLIALGMAVVVVVGLNMRCALVYLGLCGVCIWFVEFPLDMSSSPGGLGPPAEEHCKLIAFLLCDAMTFYSHRRTGGIIIPSPYEMVTSTAARIYLLLVYQVHHNLRSYAMLLV